MNTQIVPSPDGSPFDSIRRATESGREFWSARELMPLLGYDSWRRFEETIERAMIAVKNTGTNKSDHFADTGKMVRLGSGAERTVTDYEMTRFGAYMAAMNGDPRKPEIAAAQAYFAIQTHVAETAPAAPAELSRMQILQMAIDAEQKNLALTAQVTADAPKVAYVSQFVAADDRITFRTLAGNLGTPEQELRALLIGRGWIYAEQEERWSDKKQEIVRRTRYSAYSDKKQYFQNVLVHDAPRFRGGDVMHTLKITPAGAEAIARLVARTDMDGAA